MQPRLSYRLMAWVRLLWREVAKFGTVGAIGFVIDTGLYVWLISGPMADSAVKAKLVATGVATVFSWVANRYWTFRHRRQSNVAREAFLFLVMNAIGAAIQAGCVFIAQYGLGISSVLGLTIAGNVVGLFFATVFRYVSYRLWVFSEAMDADPAFREDRRILTGAIDVVAPAENNENNDDGVAASTTEAADSPKRGPESREN